MLYYNILYNMYNSYNIYIYIYVLCIYEYLIMCALDYCFVCGVQRNCLWGAA